MFCADEGEGVLDVVAVLVECLSFELVFRRPEEQSHLLGTVEGLVEEQQLFVQGLSTAERTLEDR